MDLADHFARRLEVIDDYIYRARANGHRAALAAPLAGIALLGLLSNTHAARGLVALAYAGLVMLSSGVVIYCSSQVRMVHVLGGVRQAIEEYACFEDILPAGLYVWEQGPVREVGSGLRDLKENWSFARLSEPTFAGVMYFGISSFCLYKLITSSASTSTYLFTASLLVTLITSTVAVVSIFQIPTARRRVHELIESDLKKNGTNAWGPELLSKRGGSVPVALTPQSSHEYDAELHADRRLRTSDRRRNHGRAMTETLHPTSPGQAGDR